MAQQQAADAKLRAAESDLQLLKITLESRQIQEQLRGNSTSPRRSSPSSSSSSENSASISKLLEAMQEIDRRRSEEARTSEAERDAATQRHEAAMREESRRTESMVLGWLSRTVPTTYHPGAAMQGAKFSDFAEGSPTDSEWLLAFRSRAADLGIAEENLAREARLRLTGKAEASYTQTFTDYQYNTYPSFEMIASLLHQEFGAQYQTADVFHKFVAGTRQAGSSGKAALLKVASDSQACREAGIPDNCSPAKQYYYILQCQLSADER